VILASILLAAALPAKPAPLAGLHYLVGTWNCTYRAGAVRFPYAATYVYDRDGAALRQIASWTGGSDEELLAYDAQRGWTAVVLDNHGTVMQASPKSSTASRRRRIRCTLQYARVVKRSPPSIPACAVKRIACQDESSTASFCSGVPNRMPPLASSNTSLQ
jgi:hypothetical protein